MTKIINFGLFIISIGSLLQSTEAQTISTKVGSGKLDTLILSVFNTGQQYKLTYATFGTKATVTMIAPLLMAKDTNRVHSHKACDSVVTVLKGKVALIERGEEARPSATPEHEKHPEQLAPWQRDKPVNCYCSTVQKAINAQRAGAIAVIIINEIPAHDSVAMDGVDTKKELKIPCFSISPKDGQTVQAMLPSMVAIVKPVVKQKETSSLAAVVQTEQPLAKQTNGKLAKDGTDANVFTTAGAQNGVLVGVEVFPNPTTGMAEVNYGFEEAGDVRVDVFNESGQLVSSAAGAGPTGLMKLDGRGWANGTYIVKVVSGGGKEWISKLAKRN